MTLFKKHIATSLEGTDHTVYSDIYNGECYRHLYDTGFCTENGNLTLTVNTDGIPIFKSTSLSLWPVFALINELPYKLR